MALLKVDLADLASIHTALVILNAIVAGGGKLTGGSIASPASVASAQNITANGTPDPLADMADMGGDGGDDGLGDLFPEEEVTPTGPTIDDVKNAITAMAQAKGRDSAKTLITTALGKLKVSKLEEVPADKFEILIGIIKKATA